MACEYRTRLQGRSGGTEFLVRDLRDRAEVRIVRGVPAYAVTFAAALLLCATALAGRAPVQFDSPTPAEGGVVAGTVRFGMGAVTSGGQIRALASPGDAEVPLAVTSTAAWPDGSLMTADVVFLLEPAADKSPRAWSISWGPAPRTRELTPVPTGPLPTFSVGSELDDMRPVLDVSVGQVMVRLDSHPEYYYYWYLIPIVAILALLLYRKARLR